MDYLLLCDQVLNDDISHIVSISISISVQPMDCAKDDLIVSNCPILTANGLQHYKISTN